MGCSMSMLTSCQSPRLPLRFTCLLSMLLEGTVSSSCGGLQPSAEAVLPFRQKNSFHAVVALLVVTFVTFNEEKIKKKTPPKKIKKVPLNFENNKYLKNKILNLSWRLFNDQKSSVNYVSESMAGWSEPDKRKEGHRMEILVCNIG